MMSNTRSHLITLGVFIGALLVYGLATEPTIAGWDSAELTLGVHTQGIVHATGYPLYLLLAGAFAALVPGEPALGVNLFSAVAGALTVALVYRVARPYTSTDWSAALAAGLFGVGYVMWGHATAAEVYTLHTALVAGTLLAYQGRRVWLCYTLTGLMLGHHQAGILVAAVILPALFWQNRAIWRHVLGAITALGIAGLLYGYLGWRAAAQPDFNLLAGAFSRDLTTPRDMFWMVSGGMFQNAMFAYTPSEWLAAWGGFLVELGLNTVGVGLVVGVVGIMRLWRRSRGTATLLLAIGGLQAVFFTGYNVFDKWQMLHTVYLVWAVFVAVGSEGIAARYGTRVVVAMLTVALVGQVALNWPRQRGVVEVEALAMLDALPADTVLLGPWTTIRPVEYMQDIHGERPDVALIDYTLLGLARYDTPTIPPLDAVVSEQVACSGRPVYIIAPPETLQTHYTLRLVRPTLYTVTETPQAIHSKCMGDVRRYDR